MSEIIELGKIVIDVIKKDIKNVHLSVYPPNGRVRISAPLHMNTDTIRLFAISKLSWIKKQQKKLIKQERENPREYLNRESHYIWGKRYLLNIMELDIPPFVSFNHTTLLLTVRPGTQKSKYEEIMAEWYREQLKKAIPPLIKRWERLIGVKVENFFIQHMKTKWGSCNPENKSIRLNTELAKKPPECLEYIIVHEMVHLIEPTHNQNFVVLMDKFMPKWKSHKDNLNELPVRHERWLY